MPETPSDYGWKVLTSANPAERTKKLQSEIANGRLAMIAILAMMFQNGVTGTTGPEMWLIKAFENELGVQAPTGFFDPVGFTVDGDVASSKRSRAVVLSCCQGRGRRGGALAQALEANSSLTTMHLHGNSVGDVGGGRIGAGAQANSCHAPAPVSMLGNAGNDL